MFVTTHRPGPLGFSGLWGGAVDGVLPPGWSSHLRGHTSQWCLLGPGGPLCGAELGGMEALDQGLGELSASRGWSGKGPCGWDEDGVGSGHVGGPGSLALEGGLGLLRRALGRWWRC